MVFVRLHFAKMQPQKVYETSFFTDPHIAISQYKDGHAMWFDRVPQAGEIVAIESPQKQGNVFFKVERVQHNPLEAEVATASLETVSYGGNSWITLAPIVPGLSQP